MFQGWASSLCEICCEYAQQKGFDITKLAERKRLSSAFKTDDFKRYRRQRVSSFKTDQAVKADKVKTKTPLIKVLTCVPNAIFEVIAPIMAIKEAHGRGDELFEPNGELRPFAPDPDKTFQEVVAVLRQKCAELDGDAVIGCTFEHSIRHSTIPVLGNSQTVVFCAHGTAVKLVSTPFAPIATTEPSPLP